MINNRITTTGGQDWRSCLPLLPRRVKDCEPEIPEAEDKKLSDLTVGDVNHIVGWSFIGAILLLGGFLLCVTQC